jgi:hypothetical protein
MTTCGLQVHASTPDMRLLLLQVGDALPSSSPNNNSGPGFVTDMLTKVKSIFSKQPSIAPAVSHAQPSSSSSVSLDTRSHHAAVPSIGDGPAVSVPQSRSGSILKTARSQGGVIKSAAHSVFPG